MNDSLSPAETQPLTCPVCEAGRLSAFGRESARCDSCGCLMGGLVLRMLREITDLPEPTGSHACECGHPEMRRLPDGVYWCPACGSEVLPVHSPTPPWGSEARSDAYWAGWMDGRFKSHASFADNPSLAAFEDVAARLDYYRGHREGREAAERGKTPRHGAHGGGRILDAA
jgi:ribosomal protein L37AE/L43A